MARDIICPYCHEIVDKNTPVKKFQNRTYHLACYQKYCEEKYKQDINNGQIDKHKELNDYICKIFSIKELTPLLHSQLNKLFKDTEVKYTYDGIKYTLQYFFEIKDNAPILDYGIWFVQCTYAEAKKFYLKKKELENSNVAITQKVNTIKYNERSNKKNKNFIDINKL